MMRAVCVPGQVVPPSWWQTVCAGNRSPVLFPWPPRHRVTCRVESAGAPPLRSPHLRRLGTNDSATELPVGGQMEFLYAAFFSLSLLSNGHVNLSATLYRFWNYFPRPSPSVQSRLCVKKKERKEGSTCWAPLPRLRPEDKTPKNVNRRF